LIDKIMIPLFCLVARKMSKPGLPISSALVLKHGNERKYYITIL